MKSGEGKGKCRSCGAEILWVTMEATGHLMPLDAEPVADGKIVLVHDHTAKTLAGDLFDEVYDGPRFQTHFATCPQRREWRRSKEKST